MRLRTSIQNFDTNITKLISKAFPHASWRKIFGAVTALGDPVTVIIVTACIVSVGFYYSSLAIMLSGIALPVTVISGALMKLFFERARPVSEYAANLATFSFPSGHSSGSMVTFGFLSYLAFIVMSSPLSLVMGVVLILVPIVVGVSRVRLGAHYPSDVLAGWLLGLIGLAIIIFLIQPLP